MSFLRSLIINFYSSWVFWSTHHVFLLMVNILTHMFSLAVFIRWSNISHVSSSPAPSSMCGYVCVSHSLSLLFIQCLVSLSQYLFFPYQHTLVSYILYYRDKFHSSPFAFTLSVNNPSLYYRLLVSYKNNHFLHSPHKWYIIFYLSISTFLPQIFMENLLNGILNHSPFFLQQPLFLLFITPTFVTPSINFLWGVTIFTFNIPLTDFPCLFAFLQLPSVFFIFIVLQLLQWAYRVRLPHFTLPVKVFSGEKCIQGVKSIFWRLQHFNVIPFIIHLLLCLAWIHN